MRRMTILRLGAPTQTQTLTFNVIEIPDSNGKGYEVVDNTGKPITQSLTSQGAHKNTNIAFFDWLEVDGRKVFAVSSLSGRQRVAELGILMHISE
ncbi:MULTISPECIES: hypothetical protein [Burkholderia]|uniref:hypothetical protein n=1 Tax=Burkholderia TaxID=32008 RepID=UPI00117C283A|nr:MULTISPECIES: hypothetical protein [Burkholderia]